MNEYALRNGVSVDNVPLRREGTFQRGKICFFQKSCYLIARQWLLSVIAIIWHVFAILLKKQGGWDHLHTYPALWVPDRWFEWRSILREAFALVYYRLTLSTGDVHA